MPYMFGKIAEMKKVTDTLKKLISEHGIDLLQQEQRLKAMLADLLPDEKRMRYLIDLSMRAEIPMKLKAIQLEEQAIREAHLSSMKHYFKTEFFLEDNAVKSIFECWSEIYPHKPKIIISKNNLQILNPEHQLHLEKEVIEDIDGNSYHSVKIGSQVWMCENLRTTRFYNGDSIPTTDPFGKDISNEKLPIYQWVYNGDDELAEMLGLLYTWHVIHDKRGIAPKGWRVATDDDWRKLEDYLLNSEYNLCSYKQSKLIAKAISMQDVWDINTINEIMNFSGDYTKLASLAMKYTVGFHPLENNQTNLSILPNGYRNYYGDFMAVKYSAAIWSATENSKISSWARLLDINCSSLVKNGLEKNCGLAIRCIKNT